MPLGLARGAISYMGGGGAGAVTPGWNLTGASYDSVSLNVTAREDTPTGIAFKSDGTVMYVAGSNTNRVFQYTLSTAWNISTATYANKSYLWGSTGLSGLGISPDGVYMYATFQSTSSNIRTVKLNTAWDLGSVSSWNNFSVTGNDSNPRGFFFGNGGANFWFAGDTNDTIYQYNFTTNGYDGIYSGNALSQASHLVSGTAANPNGVFFKSDGTVMYVLSNNGASSKVQSYTLGTPWSITGATTSTSFAVNGQTNTPTDLFIRPDGLKMYVVSSVGANIYQYSLT